ncbi:MAG: hypothetical protein ABIK20_04045 [Candidatus Omnitrophota bacterium]
MIKAEEKKIMRNLAKKVQEITTYPEQEEKRKAWVNHNALVKGIPMILCFPEGAWRELLPPGTLKTSDPILQEWEQRLRMIIYTHEIIKDDQVFDPFFNIGWIHKQTGWGMEIPQHRTSDLGSFRWDPPLKETGDLKKLRPNRIEVDEAETCKWVEVANDLFGDILPVRIRGNVLGSLSFTRAAVMLRGLDQLMMDMYDNPDWLRDFVTFLRNATVDWLNSLESGGYLSLNNEADYVGSGGLGITRELPRIAGYQPANVRCSDMWGFAEAQELVGVSPEMLYEFFLKYMLPILERFGLNCYGCCEPVHDRLQVIKKIPNLRRISISAWADVKRSAQELKDKYIFSYKPNPAALAAFKIDKETIRKDLVRVMKEMKEHGCIPEVVMKDTHTVRNEPQRIQGWVQIAKDARNEVYY